MTNSELITFQLFHNRQVAEEMGLLLDLEGIPYEIVENKKYFDPSFAFNKMDPEINLKLMPQDFKKARTVLERYYSEQLDSVDANYYLLKFSDTELIDIINKPDEWGIFDYALAKKLLANRGIVIQAQEEQSSLSNRLAELRKPERVEPVWIGLGYIAALAGGFFGILIGWLFAYNRKTLPDGERVFVYREDDRKHGRIMMKIGIVVFLVFMVSRLADSFL